MIFGFYSFLEVSVRGEEFKLFWSEEPFLIVVLLVGRLDVTVYF